MKTRWLVVGCVLGLAMASGCRKQGRGATSPEKLRDAHVAALQAGDARAAYALLSPQTRAATPYEAFEKRWNENAEEREATIEAAESLPADQQGATRSGTTVHEGGRVLTWTEVSGRYVVASGLPGRARAATPAEAIRSFITAVRTADLEEIRGLLADDLAARLDEDWEARAKALEDALETPGALELSSDLKRAALHYEPQRTMVLEQTPQGWRILSLQ